MSRIRLRPKVYAAVSCLFVLLSGCSPSPPEHRVRDAIYSYFATRDIQVVTLEIKNMEREPIGARQYMGPKRYIVAIHDITLETMKPKGSPVSFQDAVIIIRENTDSPHGWSVDTVSGIPML